MMFTIQFIRFRRGEPEPVSSLSYAAADAAGALAQARSLFGTPRWPSRAQAVRVLDEAGRRVSHWRVGEETPV